MSDSFAPTQRTCPQCRAEVPEDGTNGLCPACLLQEAMKSTEAKTPTEPKKRWEPPHAEDLSKLLPQYEITRMLGRGGMGAVYQGRQKSLDRAVAIKILSHDLDSADVSFAERFKNEARAMARLSHPGIVAVYDSGETADGLLYIVMEFIEGTDVARMMATNGRLHSAEAMAITAHVCDALSYAHERGIVHRDIKPANIMIGYNGVVKVADFGLAKMVKEDHAGLTQSGMAMGTLYYMAPEALMLGAGVDHRADIYAVGVMLYQMLTGKLPQGLFELPSMQIPGLDPRYDGIVAKALREDRELRYANTHEMRHDLDALLTQPVTKARENDDKASAALATQARPQRPGGQPYRPSRPQGPEHPTIILRREKQGSPLMWLMLVILTAIGGWLAVKRPWEPTAASKTVEAPMPKVQPQWINLLGDDPKKLMEFDPSASPANALVPITPNPGDENPRYWVENGVEIYTKAQHKNGVLRARISGKTENCPFMMVRHQDHEHHVWGVVFRGHAGLSAANGGSYTFAGGAVADQPLPFEIELRVDGNEYILIKDGVLMTRGLNKLYASGHVGVRLFGGMTVEKLEYLDLGEEHLSTLQPPLPEPKLLPPPPRSLTTSTEAATAATHPPSKGTSTPTQFKPGVLYDMTRDNLLPFAGFKPEPSKTRPGAQNYRATSNVTSYAWPVFKDCLVRARFNGPWSNPPQLVVRRASPSAIQRISATFVNGRASLRNHFQNGYNVFASAPLQSPLQHEQSMELELKAVGDHFTFSQDGKVLVEGNLAGYESGQVGIQVEINTILESLQVMPLDGLTPEQQAALAAEKAATPASAAPAGPAPLPADTQGMQLVMDADFAQQLPDFRDVKSSPRIEMKWQDHSYRMTAKDKAIWWPDLPLLSRLKMTDFICEAEFRMPHSANGKWGIGMHVPQQMPWIGVGMTALGRVDVFRYDEKFVVPPTATTAHPAGADAWDTLRLEAVGKRLRVFVNGLHVAEADTTGLPSPYGLNLFIGTPEPGLEVWFRRLRVWQPASATPAPSSAATSPAASIPVTPQLWTDRVGRQMKAAFLRLEQDKVVFNIAGKESIVMLHTLSDESQSQVRKLGGATVTSTPASALAPGTAPPAPKKKVGPGVFTNSLGMTFVDVPGTKVQFCTHETRFRDFMTYANTRRLSSSAPWTNQTYGGHSLGGPAPDHPVVHVTAQNAKEFCLWLSQKEGRTYRLPTDVEWTAAVTARPATGPGAKKPAPRHPWGDEWPPPRGAGNYSDETYHRLRPKDPYLPRYDDGHPTTAPVASFTANAAGLYDLGGNVWEWVSLPPTVDAKGEPVENFALRGASFLHNDQNFLLSSQRLENSYTGEADRGFRIVLEK